MEENLRKFSSRAFASFVLLIYHTRHLRSSIDSIHLRARKPTFPRGFVPRMATCLANLAVGLMWSFCLVWDGHRPPRGGGPGGQKLARRMVGVARYRAHIQGPPVFQDMSQFAELGGGCIAMDERTPVREGLLR